MHRAFVALTCCGIAACAATPEGAPPPEARGAAAQPIILAVETQLLSSADGQPDDQLGWSVALSGDGMRLVSGARFDTTPGGALSGSVRVFADNGGWAPEATLVGLDTAADDQLGWSVATVKNASRVVAGAPGDDAPLAVDGGSARVFVRDLVSWTEEVALIALDAAAGDACGTSVAFDGDAVRALVGCPGDTTADGAEAGTARVFVRDGTTWTEEATLVPSGAGAGEYFGWSVALSSDGDRALVSAPFEDGTAGAVTVFLRDGTTWTEEQTFGAPDPAAGDEFGISVSLSGDGDVALVGVYSDDTFDGPDAGSAILFRRQGALWAAETTLFADDGAAGDFFGFSTSLNAGGSVALVGAPFDTTPGGFQAGSARIFSEGALGWLEGEPLLAAQGAAADEAGISVALAGNGTRAALGVYADDVGLVTDAGSVRIFSLTASCVDAAECVSGFCVDGVCCESACGDGNVDDCIACSEAETGFADGLCAIRLGGTSCSDGDVCTDVDTCDDQGECQAGPAPDCADENDCTFDYCDGRAGCLNEAVNDGDLCEGGVCVEGECEGEGGAGGAGDGGAGGSGEGGGVGGSGEGGRGDGGTDPVGPGGNGPGSTAATTTSGEGGGPGPGPGPGPASSSGSTAATSTSGGDGDGGAGGDGAESDEGCSCATPGATSGGSRTAWLGALAVALGIGAGRRRRGG